MPDQTQTTQSPSQPAGHPDAKKILEQIRRERPDPDEFRNRLRALMGRTPPHLRQERLDIVRAWLERKPALPQLKMWEMLEAGRSREEVYQAWLVLSTKSKMPPKGRVRAPDCGADWDDHDWTGATTWVYGRGDLAGGRVKGTIADHQCKRCGRQGYDVPGVGRVMDIPGTPPQPY
ncbi:MAG: hypothetical protein KGJ23_12520 [Euryarchaeota archaeon]|nr:hypothetical protein [Euryarchaeota archaeon]MDE1837422.1 hypothetical protein [Euryarchaeota archaeon]MDE1881947.1 hypothetical protein [Euryarchaeota archaeon]MDE2045612.1 hypothetical protein [Thermoplasmata archaeon]